MCVVDSEFHTEILPCIALFMNSCELVNKFHYVEYLTARSTSNRIDGQINFISQNNSDAYTSYGISVDRRETHCENVLTELNKPKLMAMQNEFIHFHLKNFCLFCKFKQFKTILKSMIASTIKTYRKIRRLQIEQNIKLDSKDGDTCKFLIFVIKPDLVYMK